LITDYKNESGYIYAYIVWNIVDGETRICDNGKYIAINGLWVHPEFRHLGIIKTMVADLWKDGRTKTVEYVFYLREKGNKMSGIIPIYKFIRRYLNSEAKR